MQPVNLKEFVSDVPDFPVPGILFRDISPLLRSRFSECIGALEAVLTDAEWQRVDVVAGIESRGFILASALADRRRKGFVLVRKKGKLPPPVVDMPYALEYGSATLEMQPGQGRLLLIDDVLATGGTLTAASDLCAQAGYEPVAIAVLIDLQLVRGFRWNGIAPRAVIRYD